MTGIYTRLTLITSIAVFMVIARPGYSQQIYWQRYYDNGGLETASGVLEDASGNYYVVGTSFKANGSAASLNGYIVNVDRNGNRLWATTVGGNSSTSLVSIIETTNGELVTTGYTNRDQNGPTSNNNILLYRLDTGSTFISEKFFGNSLNELATKGIPAADDGIAVTGHADRNVFLYRFTSDSSSTPVWMRSYDNGGFDIATDMVMNNDNGYTLVGYTNGNPGKGWDILAIRTDMNGDTLWMRSIGSEKDEFGYVIEKTGDGSFIIAGTAQDKTEFGYIVKLDSSGHILWSRNLTLSNEKQHPILCSANLADGSFLFGGSIGNGIDSSRIFLWKVDNDGNTVWADTLSSDNRYLKISDIIQAQDGSYVLAGTSDATDSDFFIMKVHEASSSVESEYEIPGRMDLSEAVP